MFGRAKKMVAGHVSEPASRPCPQRRLPTTPPLPVRTLQPLAKKPETRLVLRDRKKIRGHRSGVRGSWPGTGLNPPSDMSIPDVQGQSCNQSQPYMTQPALTSALQPSQSPLLPATSHRHWSIPLKDPLRRWSSEASMVSLLLSCRSIASNTPNSIDNKIEQAMDLVKSHLILAVRQEVELLRERVRELQEKNRQLESENHILRTVI